MSDSYLTLITRDLWNWPQSHLCDDAGPVPQRVVAGRVAAAVAVRAAADARHRHAHVAPVAASQLAGLYLELNVYGTTQAPARSVPSCRGILDVLD